MKQLTREMVDEAAKWGGQVTVDVVIGGNAVCFGNAEYLTADNYVGVRQPGGGLGGRNRLDEFPLEVVFVDPT